MPALPRNCEIRPANTPEGNFEIFAASFQEHYAFFDLHGVDWPSRVNHARQSVRADMSDAALLRLFADMIAPLDDAHVAELDGQTIRHKPARGAISDRTFQLRNGLRIFDPAALEALQRQYAFENVGQTVLAGHGIVAPQWRPSVRRFERAGRYINLLAMAGFSGRKDNETADLRVFQAALDEMFTSFQVANVRAVIVDVSPISGGYNFISQHLADRFASEPAHAITVGIAGRRVHDIFLHPNNRPGFDGPVVVVTSEATLSAAENFVLMMRALPQVTHMGQRTSGAFSQILEKELPNGWRVGLSAYVLRDHNGDLWKGIGIQPDQNIPIFSASGQVTPHLGAIAEIAEQLL